MTAPRDRFEHSTKYAQQIAEVENRNVIKLVLFQKRRNFMSVDVKKKFLSLTVS